MSVVKIRSDHSGVVHRDTQDVRYYPVLSSLRCDGCGHQEPAEEEQPLFIHFIREGWFISLRGTRDYCCDCNSYEVLHRTMQLTPDIAHPLMTAYYYRYLMRKED